MRVIQLSCHKKKKIIELMSKVFLLSLAHVWYRSALWRKRTSKSCHTRSIPSTHLVNNKMSCVCVHPLLNKYVCLFVCPPVLYVSKLRLTDVKNKLNSKNV